MTLDQAKSNTGIIHDDHHNNIFKIQDNGTVFTKLSFLPHLSTGPISLIVYFCQALPAYSYFPQ
jgi:hypothetical protein